MEDSEHSDQADTGAGHGISRRGVLAAAAALVAAGGAGAAVAAVRPVDREPRAAPPAELSAALAAERVLLDTIDDAVARDPALRGDLAAIRADHAAHLQALRAAAADYPAPPSPGRAEPAPQSLDRSGLRAAEQVAATRAARRAAILGGRNAALLASIAACEASHAELLS